MSKNCTVKTHFFTNGPQLIQLRAAQPCFGSDAWVTTWDTHNDHVLAIVRKTEEETLVGLFNFSGQEQEVRLDAMQGEFTDLISGESCRCGSRIVGPYQYALCLRAGQ